MIKNYHSSTGPHPDPLPQAGEGKRNKKLEGEIFSLNVEDI